VLPPAALPLCAAYVHAYRLQDALNTLRSCPQPPSPRAAHTAQLLSSMAQLLCAVAPADASPALLHDIACRCALNGGQLRNIALHCRLLALESGKPPGDAQLRAAVIREYRKTDSHCPLKPALAAIS
jgi:hypothetical protein